ncbi:MAG: hypothetical protein ABI076_05560 [Acidobacteriaceae bacterium]
MTCIFFTPQLARAQGCIIAHSVGGVGGPLSQGGYLQKGHLELSLGYRHQYSFRHFVGDTEQVYRTQGHTEVRNRINLIDAELTYQITPRWSAVLNVPLEYASRRYNIPAYSLGNTVSITGDYGLSGMGDIGLLGQVWIWSPEHATHHNIQIGFGIQAPTGRDNIQNRLILIPGTQPIDSTADYSIQPGIGGWGIPISWQSFQALGKTTQVYFNGTYLITPQETNGVANVPPPGFPPPAPQNAYVSIADEYLLQPGVGYSFVSLRGLTATIGLRDEGVPAHDLIGGDEGFRRPGYAVSLEPGLQYLFHHGSDLLTANVDRALYRNRVPSVPDIQLGGKGGDAAFADWVWLASFSHRF